VGADQIGDVARSAGLVLRETWTADGRWFADLGCEPSAPAIADTWTGEYPVAAPAAPAAAESWR
jgi:hypothetical protein